MQKICHILFTAVHASQQYDEIGQIRLKTTDSTFMWMDRRVMGKMVRETSAIYLQNKPETL